MRLTLSLLLMRFGGALRQQPSLAQSALDTAKIEQIIGVKGAMNPDEHVFKVTKARNDVKVLDRGLVSCRPSWALAPGLRSRPLPMAERW